MRWLWFVAAIVCLAIVFRTHSMGLAVLALLGTLGFLLAGVVAVVSGRIEGRTRDVSSLLGPDELRRLREAEQRKREAGVGGVQTSPEATDHREGESPDPDRL